MQDFIVTVKVKTNSLDTVSEEEVAEAIGQLLHDFDGGTADVVNVVEQ